MSVTYWDGHGTFQSAAELLHRLLPKSGTIDGATSNEHLEAFRQASNCYYDLFNNGGCNRQADILRIFGIDADALAIPLTDEQWDGIHAQIEPIMDRIIAFAMTEQFDRISALAKVGAEHNTYPC